MKFPATLLLATLLATGCTVAEPQRATPPPTAVGGITAATPSASLPTAIPRSVALPGAEGELTKRLVANWQGSTVIWRVVLLDLLVDPANPLKLSDTERETARTDLRQMIEADEEVAARSSLLTQTLGEKWVAPKAEQENAVPMPEDAFLAQYPALVKALAQKADGRTASPAVLPENLREPEVSEDEQAIAEDDFPRRPDEIAAALLAMAPAMKPEQAAGALAELQAMEAPVKQMASAWDGLLDVTGTPERLALVKERATKQTGKPFDTMDVMDRVMHFVAGKAS